MLFLDFSSAFNHNIPEILVEKLFYLGLSTPICFCIKYFLTNPPQSVICVITLTNPTAPQSISQIPLFADDTMVVALISGGDESDCRDEVNRLTAWCSVNNLLLNTTKRTNLDFTKGWSRPRPTLHPQVLRGRIHSIRFVSVQISDLSWTANTTMVMKKAQQWLHLMRVLRKNNLEKKLLVTFYRAIIESILGYCITAWYAGCSAANGRTPQRVNSTPQKITGSSLPRLEYITNSR